MNIILLCKKAFLKKILTQTAIFISKIYNELNQPLLKFDNAGDSLSDIMLFEKFSTKKIVLCKDIQRCKNVFLNSTHYKDSSTFDQKRDLFKYQVHMICF
ncbi:hypothetical protein BpHYR1_002751 [Brachionus plicatilis]|uniref:Uncharacterized protein n=1 Tax=Brachionus plicatilis TaxID=10195 RepID=A0A3M7P3E3_BRAPC|nr:hypothetical protein BpHYR1_002751 [Brachionus plicatilis]